MNSFTGFLHGREGTMNGTECLSRNRLAEVFLLAQ